MTGDRVELLGNQLTLHGDLFALFGHRGHALHERLRLLFQTSNGLHGAVNENRDRHHGDRDHDKRSRDNDHDPEQRIAGAHL
jgi:hypothetical protein